MKFNFKKFCKSLKRCFHFTLVDRVLLSESKLLKKIVVLKIDEKEIPHGNSHPAIRKEARLKNCDVGIIG